MCEFLSRYFNKNTKMGIKDVTQQDLLLSSDNSGDQFSYKFDIKKLRLSRITLKLDTSSMGIF